MAKPDSVGNKVEKWRLNKECDSLVSFEMRFVVLMKFDVLLGFNGHNDQAVSYIIQSYPIPTNGILRPLSLSFSLFFKSLRDLELPTGLDS
jgi:hypothetical protein